MPFKTKEELESHIQKLKSKPVTTQVLVCGGLGCLAKGADAVYQRFKELIEKNQLSVTVGKTANHHQPTLKETGCMGFCDAGPLVRIEPKGILYLKVKPEDVDRIVEETLKNNKVVDDLVFKEETNQEVR
ncbi:MAG: (2Fe-2S) ferredoxin domain-containing protein, partial [Candidatus Atribacteria bacterium]|nr:(2Fe-2S) ferredoxin domain-containing protein [Candidatus Atribacteria bacterium]